MMNDIVNSAAIIVLSIGAITQRRALRRLQREHSALRRAHHDALNWYQMSFEGLRLRPTQPIALPSSNDVRNAQ